MSINIKSLQNQLSYRYKQMDKLEDEIELLRKMIQIARENDDKTFEKNIQMLNDMFVKEKSN